MQKIVFYILFALSGLFSSMMKFYAISMHGLYSKIMADRLAEGKPGYPLYVEIMDNMVRLTLLFSSLLFVGAVIVCFDKNLNKTPKIVLISISILGLIPHLVIV